MTGRALLYDNRHFNNGKKAPAARGHDGRNPNSSCPALRRASTSLLSCCLKDVDGRDKPGHDG
jgi:hypothetical protein